MKKIFYFMSLLLAAGTSSLMVSCEDNGQEAAPGTDRQFMTMFITDYTRGKGTDYPYNCGLDGAYPHGNTIHLYWYGVKDCAGYQVQMALQPKVAGGSDAWAAVQGTNDLLFDTIVGPSVLDLLIKDLQYSTDYRFAIRALSKLDNNTTDFTHASNWYGHGNGRQWQEYMGIKTNDRYETPFAVYVDQSQTTEQTLNVHLNTNVLNIVSGFSGVTADQIAKLQAMSSFTAEDIKTTCNLAGADADKVDSYYENFNVDEKGNFGYKYLTVAPSPNNPNSTVGKKWEKYEITDEDRKNGMVVVDGLTANSVYVIDVIDPRIPILMDSKYNTCTARSDGKPGDPILLKYDELMTKYGENRADTFALATSQYKAAPISPTLLDFISNTNYAEGQSFYLEGGKTYYMDGNDITCKGFVLATDPADVAQGKRARVICGIGKNSNIYSGTNGEQWQGSYTMFMFGRQPEAGEGGEIYMKKLAFYDIDFDNPTALNYGDNAAGVGTVAGNYFFNMYSNGMAVTLDSLVIENCTFKRLVRGFIREQGANYKVWNHVLIRNNQFMDCGFYNQGAGGYPWIAGSGTNANSNLYKDFKCIENTFYDSPFPSFFAEENTQQRLAGAWYITFSNNTLINFNTRSSGAIIKMRNLPNGSVYTVENNLFVLTKKEGDQRVLQMWGADIRDTETLDDGTSGKVTLNFNNNWSTNNDLTNGSIFSANAWTSTSNNFGKLVKDGNAKLNGSLEVEVADVSATELFTSPCPPHVATSANDRHMHRADALDGSATTEFNVNLYYKNAGNLPANVGDPRWKK